MDRVVEPQIHRVEPGELTQRALDAPGCHPGGAFLAGGNVGIQCTQVGQTQLLFGNRQHPGTAAGVILAVTVGMAAGVQQGRTGRAGGFVLQLVADGIRGRQLCHVQHSVRVAGKHAGTTGAVHAALAALSTFAVVVAVDDGAAQLTADQIELVAKLGHLVSAVLVAGDDFINRVQYHRNVALLGGPADEPRGQLVHRHRRAAQVPHIDAAHVVRGIAQCRVHILEAVQAAGAVEFQVDVHHLALGAAEPSQPRLALGNADAQLDQGKALARLAGTCQQHLVPLAQHAVDEGIRQRRQVAPVVGQVLGVR